MEYYRYWGKARPDRTGGASYHLLPYHSLDVAAVGRTLVNLDQKLRQRLVRKTGLNETVLVPLVTFLLSLHDLGKFAEGFQNLRPEIFKPLRGRVSQKDYTVRHDSLGNLLWCGAVWPTGWKEGWLRLGQQEFADMYDWQDLFGAWTSRLRGTMGRRLARAFTACHFYWKIILMRTRNQRLSISSRM